MVARACTTHAGACASRVCCPHFIEKPWTPVLSNAFHLACALVYVAVLLACLAGGDAVWCAFTVPSDTLGTHYYVLTLRWLYRCVKDEAFCEAVFEHESAEIASFPHTEDLTRSSTFALAAMIVCAIAGALIPVRLAAYMILSASSRRSGVCVRCTKWMGGSIHTRWAIWSTCTTTVSAILALAAVVWYHDAAAHWAAAHGSSILLNAVDFHFSAGFDLAISVCALLIVAAVLMSCVVWRIVMHANNESPRVPGHSRALLAFNTSTAAALPAGRLSASRAGDPQGATATARERESLLASAPPAHLQPRSSEPTFVDMSTAASVHTKPARAAPAGRSSRAPSADHDFDEDPTAA